MDIIKKASLNLVNCKATKDSVYIFDEEYEGDKAVEFPTKLSKEYNLSAIVFYLLNSNKSITEYLALCKKSKINPISHVDKASIQNGIETYAAKKVPGYFMRPEYTRLKPYDMELLPDKNIIIVPDNISSKIHMGNIEKLLVLGVFEEIPFNPLFGKVHVITINNIDFEVRSDIKNFTDSDWKSIRAIFKDSLQNLDSDEVISKIPRNANIFSLSDEKFKSIQILIKNNKIHNHKEIISSLIAQF